MRILKLLSILFLLLLVVHSCKDDFINQDPLSESIGEDLPQRQMQSDVDPAPCRTVSGINIFIAPACGPNWTTGVIGAMAEYNATNTPINMVQVTNAGLADIVIDCEDFAETTEMQHGATINWATIIGIAEVPNNDGGLGSRVFFNTDFETTCPNPCFFQGVAMHELGHNLGFWHNENDGNNDGLVGTITSDGDGTFSYTGDTGGIEWIPGTAAAGTFDAGSIFNEATGCFGANCTFNANDLIALETMFPFPEDLCACPEVIFPENHDCFCVCYEVFIYDEENWQDGIVRKEISRTPVACETAIPGDVCGAGGGKVSYCVIESVCTWEPEPVECECFCVCGFQVPPEFGGEYVEVSRVQVSCDGVTAGLGCGTGPGGSSCYIEIDCP